MTNDELYKDFNYETNKLEKDSRVLFRASLTHLREFWGEIAGHGYGHTSVWHLNLVTLGFLALTGYWTWLITVNPLNNDAIFCLWFALFSIWHTRNSLAIYNPANWLSMAAFQAWLSQVVVGMVAVAVLLIMLLAHSASCIRDPARQGQSCPWRNGPDAASLGCVLAPSSTSPCLGETRGDVTLFIVMAVVQKLLYMGMVFTVSGDMQLYREHALKLIRAVDIVFAKSEREDNEKEERAKVAQVEEAVASTPIQTGSQSRSSRPVFRLAK